MLDISDKLLCCYTRLKILKIASHLLDPTRSLSSSGETKFCASWDMPSDRSAKEKEEKEKSVRLGHAKCSKRYLRKKPLVRPGLLLFMITEKSVLVESGIWSRGPRHYQPSHTAAAACLNLHTSLQHTIRVTCDAGALRQRSKPTSL